MDESGPDAGVQGFLAALGPSEAAALATLGRRRRFNTGTTILREGTRSDTVVLVIGGRLKLSYLTKQGRESVLALVGPGSVLGELSAIDGEPHVASAVALEPVEAVVITGDRFREFITERPAAALALLRTVTRRLRASNRKQVEFGTQDTMARLARCLVELADQHGERDGDSIAITVKLSQDELASLTGCSREAVVKALRVLRDREWIETSRRSIRVLDLEALAVRSL